MSYMQYTCNMTDKLPVRPRPISAGHL